MNKLFVQVMEKVTLFSTREKASFVNFIELEQYTLNMSCTFDLPCS